ncbi:C2 family cysteine protease [Nocardia sp. NPDC050175]|uniref:C2 family cysteine protease n=1 Tax=Nocardia sp. NPDC050175 TaxID=3364317 RepID=UPI0037998F5E
MSGQQFEHYAGTELRTFNSHSDITRHLERLGDGAISVVVDVYNSFIDIRDNPADVFGIGAHAVVFENQGGTVFVYDPATGRRYPVGEHPSIDGGAVLGVVYASDGSPQIVGGTHGIQVLGNVRIGANNRNDAFTDRPDSITNSTPDMSSIIRKLSFLSTDDGTDDARPTPQAATDGVVFSRSKKALGGSDVGMIGRIGGEEHLVKTGISRSQLGQAVDHYAHGRIDKANKLLGYIVNDSVRLTNSGEKAERKQALTDAFGDFIRTDKGQSLVSKAKTGELSIGDVSDIHATLAADLGLRTALGIPVVFDVINVAAAQHLVNAMQSTYLAAEHIPDSSLLVLPDNILIGSRLIPDATPLDVFLTRHFLPPDVSLTDAKHAAALIKEAAAGTPVESDDLTRAQNIVSQINDPDNLRASQQALTATLREKGLDGLFAALLTRLTLGESADLGPDNMLVVRGDYDRNKVVNIDVTGFRYDRKNDFQADPQAPPRHGWGKVFENPELAPTVLLDNSVMSSRYAKGLDSVHTAIVDSIHEALHHNATPEAEAVRRWYAALDLDTINTSLLSLSQELQSIPVAPDADAIDRVLNRNVSFLGDIVHASRNFDITKFLSKQFGAEYPIGTELYLHASTGDIRATFRNQHVELHSDDDRQPTGTNRRTDQSDSRSVLANGTQHTIEDFWDHLLAEHTAMGVERVTLVRAHGIETPADHAAAFEPREGDTYFGNLLEKPAKAELLEQLEEAERRNNPWKVELLEELLKQLERAGIPGVTVPRTHFDEKWLERPAPLADHERLENLSDAQRQELIPVVPATLLRPKRWDGEISTLVDYNGDVTDLPTHGNEQVVMADRDGHDYYEFDDPVRGKQRIPVELAADFDFDVDPGDPDGRLGTLSWDLPDGLVRCYAFDETGLAHMQMFYGDRLVGKPGDGPWRWIRSDEGPKWFRVNAPTSVLPEFPRFVARPDDPIFAEGGARSQDARQTLGVICWLVAPLKDRADRHQQMIHAIIHNYGDGTGAVLLKVEVDGKWTWKWQRVLLGYFQTPGTTSGHIIGHEPGDPQWPSMIVNAWALQFGEGNGHLIFAKEGYARQAGEHLSPGFYRAPEGWRQQPIANVDGASFLNPLRFDINTLHAVVGGDLEFSRNLADTFPNFVREAKTRNEKMWEHLVDIHNGDMDEVGEAMDRFMNSESIGSPPGFRTYLDEQFPNRWDAEKDTLATYFDTVFQGPAEHRLLAAPYLDIVGRAISELIRYAHERDTTVILGMNGLGPDFESITAVPGLVGGHSYRVIGTEPRGILLESPWDHHGPYLLPDAGIEYRLDPAPRGTVDYITDKNGSHRTTTDGTVYGTYTNGTVYRRDPDTTGNGFTEYGITREATTYRETSDGTRHERYPTSERYWRTSNGTEYRTLPDGTKERKQRHDTDWSPDTRDDPPDDITIPRRGGILFVDFKHLVKFSGITLIGPAGRAAYEDVPDYSDQGGTGAPIGRPAHRDANDGPERPIAAPTSTALHVSPPSGGDVDRADDSRRRRPPAGLGTSKTWWRDVGESWWNKLDFYNLTRAEQLRLLTDFPALRTTVPMDSRYTHPGLEPGLGQQQEVELGGPTRIRRQRFTQANLHPPRLRRWHWLPKLTDAQRERAMPTPGVPMRLPRPAGPNLLTLVDAHGRVERLGAKGEKVPAELVRHGNGPGYYTIMPPNEPIRYVHENLAWDFKLERDPSGGSIGLLSWDVPGGQARFLAFDAGNNPIVEPLDYGSQLVVKHGSWPWRWVKMPHWDGFVRINAPHDVLPALPALARRWHDPMYGPDGPKPGDVGQGLAGNCSLLADLKWLAEHDPQAIEEMLHDNGDGTVFVRLLPNNDGNTRPVWVRAEKLIYVEPGTETGYFIRHSPGEPLWATMIEKAYAQFFGGADGYLVVHSAPLALAASRFGKGFHLAPGGYLRQPVHAVHNIEILNPFRFDLATLHELVSAHVLRDQGSSEPDIEFSRAFAETYDEWCAPRDAGWKRLQRVHRGDQVALDNAWQEFLRTEDPASPTGFRRFLDRLHPNRWEREKDALTRYFQETYGGQAQDRLLSAQSMVAARAIGRMLEWAHRRGTRLTIATHSWPADNGNPVAGLVPGHAYTFLRIECDSTGTPVRMLLENPHDLHAHLVPIAGIENRLDPRGIDYSGEGRVDRTSQDGTRYITKGSRANRKQYRIDPGPDGAVYGLAGNSRIYTAKDKTFHRTDADGKRYRSTKDGTEFSTSRGGRKYIKRRGDADWIPDPDREDPPDPTDMRRGGIIAVDFEHVAKFSAIGMSGPGAYGLYRPERVDRPLDGAEDNVLRTLFDEPVERVPALLDAPEQDSLRELFGGPSAPPPTGVVGRPYGVHDKGRIDENGVRVFDTDDAGADYGFHHLRIWDNLRDRVRTALRAHEEWQVPNRFLRLRTPEAFDQLWAELHGSNEIEGRVFHALGTDPDLDAVIAHRSTLSSIDNPTPAQARELRALDRILGDPDPDAYWQQIRDDADEYRRINDHYQEHFRVPFNADTFRMHVALLDEAANHPLPLTEPIRVLRALDHIDFMAIDEHGNTLNGQRDLGLVLNVRQQDPAYPSTSLTAEPADIEGQIEYLLILTVPPGARGVYIGEDGYFPHQNELLLARDTSYRITGFDQSNPDLTVLYAHVEPAIPHTRIGLPRTAVSSRTTTEPGITDRPGNPNPAAPVSRTAVRSGLPYGRHLPLTDTPGRTGEMSEGALRSPARPTVSRENLDSFLRDIWNIRESIHSADEIYDLYSDRGAGERAEVEYVYLDALMEILDSRAPGPAREAIVPGYDRVLTADDADHWTYEDIPFVQYNRVQALGGMRGEEIGFKVYVNTSGSARPGVTARVVREVIDDPDRFPGVYAAKVAGPLERRVDGLVIYLRDQEAVHRVIEWLRDVQSTDADSFLWDVPPMTEQVLAGVGFAAERPQESFGWSRARIIFSALGVHRGGNIEGFHGEVLNRFRVNGIDPDRPHLNLSGTAAAALPAHAHDGGASYGPGSPEARRLHGTLEEFDGSAAHAPRSAAIDSGREPVSQADAPAISLPTDRDAADDDDHAAGSRSAAEPEDFPEDEGSVPGLTEYERRKKPPPAIAEGRTDSPAAPWKLAVEQVDTIGDTGNTVLIARNGAVVIGPGDSVLWDGHEVNGNARIRLSSNPDVPYRVHGELLAHLDWIQDGESGGWKSLTRGERPATRLVFYDSDVKKAVQLGVGDLVPTWRQSNGSVRIESLVSLAVGPRADRPALFSRVVIPREAVLALGMGGSAAAQVMVEHKGPLFSALPSESDAREGAWGDYSGLMTNLGRLATLDPHGLVEMFRELPDGTVEVRFFIDGVPFVVPVDRRLLHDSSGSPMHAGHTDGEPMWAPLAQKAFAMLGFDIGSDLTVSARPFGEPIQPPPIRPMPSTEIAVPRDRLTIVDVDGGVLSVRPGDTLHGTEHPQDPTLLEVMIGADPVSPVHVVHRDLLGELTVFGSDSKDRYHWTTPASWSPATAAYKFLGLRLMLSNSGRTHIPADSSISLDVGNGGELLLGGDTQITEGALQKIGYTIQTASGPVFGEAGPVPEDVAQGSLGDCHLLAPLEIISKESPPEVRAMFSLYRDGTVLVRSFTSWGAPRWVRVNRKFYADADGCMIYAAHDARRALWPALAEKGYASRRRGGFAAIKGEYPGRTMRELLPPYKAYDSGTVHQPVSALDLQTFLHPMRFGVDTLYELVVEQVGDDADRDSVFDFARRLGELEPKWMINVRASGDAVEPVELFRNFLNYHLQPDERTQWRKEIAAVLDYLEQVGDPRETLTSSVVLRHFADLFRFLRGRGDTIILSTRKFGDENPGLVETHAYSVSDVRPRVDGGLDLVLENPHDSNPNVPQKMDGLTYGSGGTLTLDAAHLTKFCLLSIRGAGTRFAFGDSPIPPSNDGPKPETGAPTSNRTAGSLLRDNDFPGADRSLSGPAAAARSVADIISPYARALSAVLGGPGPVDFAQVLTILRHTNAAQDARPLEAAFGGTLRDIVREAVAQKRFPETQALRMARLLGWEPAEELPADAPAPPSVAVRPGAAPEQLPQVEQYARAVWNETRAEAALALTARLDRDLPTLWAVRDAYRQQPGGRELIADLRRAFPDEHDYIDHVFAEPSAKVAAGEPDAVPTPVLEDTALDWIRTLGDMPFENRTGAQAQLDAGSAERAHLMALALVRWGAHPRRITVSGEGMRITRTLPDGSRHEVPVQRYVANLVYTVQGGTPGWQVFDPALGRTPLREQEVRIALNASRAPPRGQSGTPTPVTIETSEILTPDALEEFDRELRRPEPRASDASTAQQHSQRAGRDTAVTNPVGARGFSALPSTGAVGRLDGVLDEEYWVIHGVAKGYTNGEIRELLGQNGFPHLSAAGVSSRVKSLYASAGITSQARDGEMRLREAFIESYRESINQETLDGLPLWLSKLDIDVFDYAFRRPGRRVSNVDFYQEVGTALAVSSKTVRRSMMSILARVGISSDKWIRDERGRKNFGQTFIALASSLEGRLGPEALAEFRNSGGAQQWRAPPLPSRMRVVDEGPGDGSSVHPGDTPGSGPVGPVISDSGPRVGSPVRMSRGDCGTLALEFVARLNPGARIRLSGGSVGLFGMTGPQFEFDARARLQHVDTLGPVIGLLRTFGHGSLSLVVGVHASVDARGFGARSVVMYNRGGALWVYDPETGDHPLEHHSFPEVRAWLVIVYGTDGSPQTIADYPDNGAAVLGDARIGAPSDADDRPAPIWNPLPDTNDRQ